MRDIAKLNAGAAAISVKTTGLKSLLRQNHDLANYCQRQPGAAQVATFKLPVFIFDKLLLALETPKIRLVQSGFRATGWKDSQ